MSDTCNEKIVTLESRHVELFNLEMAKLRILRKAQREEKEAKLAEEKKRKEELERAKLLSDLKNVASRKLLEDSEDQALQNKMKACVHEMSDATSSNDSDLLKAITKVLACYQSKLKSNNKIKNNYFFTQNN